MTSSNRTTFLALAYTVCVVSASILAGAAMVTPSQAQGDPPLTALPAASPTHEGVAPVVSATVAVYAPLVPNAPTPTPEPTAQPTLQPQPLPTPSPPTTATTVFGIEMESVWVGGERVSEAGTTWVRRNGLKWADIEPTEGVRDWSAAAALEAELIEAARLNFTVILIVRRTPTWAQKYPGVFCGPIRSDKMAAFGRFMGDAVARYSAPPYNVKYWEIWNEPDSGGSDPNGDRVYGCWGEQADTYYGGRHYALALKAAYPEVKAADPDSQVLVGGLLANCDPIQPPSGRDCKQSRFLEGILVAGGAPYFDGVSFHTYDYYFYPGAYGSDNWHSAWNTTGPLLIAKGRYLRSVLEARGVTGKFMLDTELGLLCSACPDSAPEYELTKATYVVQAYAASMAEGLLGTTWYSLGGWLGTGLLDGAGNPKPALIAYRVARMKFGEATYVGKVVAADVGGVTGVTGYRFRRGQHDVWVIWTLKGDAKTVRFSEVPDVITDQTGASAATSAAISLRGQPLIIEWIRP